MITRTMSPVMLRKEIQTDIIENILPYLKRNYDNKIRRAIVKSTHLPMIFNPIHYFSKKTHNDWYILLLKNFVLRCVADLYMILLFILYFFHVFPNLFINRFEQYMISRQCPYASTTFTGLWNRIGCSSIFKIGCYKDFTTLGTSENVFSSIHDIILFKLTLVRYKY